MPAQPIGSEEPATLIMDERQQRIFDALIEKERPDLASMYRGALSLLAAPANAGDERTRISHICHSMREVMNRGLGAMGSTSSPPIKPPSGQQVQALPDLISQFPGLHFDAEGEFIPVPRAVADVLDKLVKTAVQEKRRIRDDIASLLTDDGNSNHLAVTRWNESSRFFTRWAHLGDNSPERSTLPSDDLIRTHVTVFDELLDGVMTAFFARLRSLDNLLADINAPQEIDDE